MLSYDTGNYQELQKTGLLLRNSSPATAILKPLYLLYTHIVVTSYEFLNRNPEKGIDFAPKGFDFAPVGCLIADSGGAVLHLNRGIDL